MSLHDDLVAARKLVANGWTKGMFRRNGCVCAMGAVLWVVDSDDDEGIDREDEAIRALEAALPVCDVSTLVGFNDREATTHADVLALFDRAIAASVQS